MFRHAENIFTPAAAAMPAAKFRLGAAAMLTAALGMSAAALLAAALILSACSAAPVKMECREIEMRIEYSDLTRDQMRFAMQELEECRRKLESAEAKDSAFIEGAEKRFTPADP